MIGLVTGTEVKLLLFIMTLDKIPGLDVYTVEFYRTAWQVTDLITTVQSFFLFGLMPRRVNTTILSLVPKTVDAKTMKDYRPIACCNILYKIISKIIVNILKATLQHMIELNQTVFIKDKLLLEDILLATELVKDYHKDSISSRCEIKFDISKAFDMVQKLSYYYGEFESHAFSRTIDLLDKYVYFNDIIFSLC